MRILHPTPDAPSRQTDSIIWRRMKSVSSIVEDNTTVLSGNLIWQPSSSGKFTFSSAYNLFRPTRCVTLTSSRIWSRIIPLKISVFLWRLFRCYLPFPDCVQKFGFHLHSVCPFCWNESASLNHCLWICPCVQRIWQYFSNLLDVNLSLASSVRSVCQVWWLTGPSAVSHANCSIVSTTLRHLMPCYILWILWKNYNLLIHEGGNFSQACIIKEVKREFFTMSVVHPLRSSSSSDHRFIDSGLVASFAVPRPKKTLWIKWHCPPSGRLKLNSDASFSSVSCGGGAVLRNSEGFLVAALLFPLSASCALQAEALALAFAMRWCDLVARKPTFIEVDSSVLVHLILHHEASVPWKIRQSVNTIRHLLSSWSASLSHSYREANQVADSLASIGCTLEHPSLYFDCNLLPASVQSALLYDCRGFATPRLFFH